MSDVASKELAEVRWRKLRRLLRERGILRVEELAAGLAAMTGVPRLGLLNAAFHAPERPMAREEIAAATASISL